MKKIQLISLFVLLTLAPALPAAAQGTLPAYSVAGLFPEQDCGRQVFDFNTGWLFSLPYAPLSSEVSGTETPVWAGTDFDDRTWERVALPHTVKLMPAEASGNRNYQGPAWYRKRFTVPAELSGSLLQLYFEAAMGKADVWVNGKHALTHLGGYLPFAVNLEDFGIGAGDECVIAVCADNSDDRSFPPGKTQYTLDFCYHGGIYRDAWLIARNPLHITDPVVERHETAGGGVFVHYDRISDASADILVETEIGNGGAAAARGTLELTLCDADGRPLSVRRSSVQLRSGAFRTVSTRFTVKNPRLWSPEDPYLYKIQLRLIQGGRSIDGGMVRAGVRLAEFRGADGFWLNGRRYHQLIGTNRHQDFAYVGNALPNSQHWRDVRMLREAGCTIIRSAHYPQDPAFMDACDELGIFMIVPTPGWQFWNRDPSFADYVYDDVTQMVRRDRNHPSVLLWEPILNETQFPADFSLKTLELTKAEFPYPGAPLSAADMKSAGVAEHYGVVYGWPADTGKVRQSIFTREFGENVDDWYAHNCNNRVSRSWGEQAQVLQAMSLADSYDEMFRAQPQFIGGAQWHSFDHQRGYHPDPYWGGMADAFRQEKYAYWMFRSQSPASLRHPIADGGPMVFIAHEIMPTSSPDVVVFSNCDSVRLIIHDTDTLIKPVVHAPDGMPNRPVVFEGAYDFWDMRELSYFQKSPEKVSFVAEGIIGGEVVCSSKKMPSRRSTSLSLRLDRPWVPLCADGSDFVVVVCEVTDDNGNVRRLAKENIVFEVEGEGSIIGDASIGANPRAVEFGSAPVLIRSTTTPGRIKVTARVQFEGQMAPHRAVLEFDSVPATLPFCAGASLAGEAIGPGSPNGGTRLPGATASPAGNLSRAQLDSLLRQVQQQQQDFGEGRK